MTSHLIPIKVAIIKKTRTGVGEDVEKLEPLCPAGGNVEWCHCHVSPFDSWSRKLSLELSYDRAIPLTSIYPEELKAGTCTSVFTAVLFTIAKGGSRPSVP